MSDNKNMQEMLISQTQEVFDKLLSSNSITENQRMIYSMVSHNLKNPDFQKLVLQAQQNPEMITQMLNGQDTTNTENL